LTIAGSVLAGNVTAQRFGSTVTGCAEPKHAATSKQPCAAPASAAPPACSEDRGTTDDWQAPLTQV
jgi:hypothetical protein